MKTAAASIASSHHQPAPQPVLGVVKSTYPRLDPSRSAVNDADFSGAAELDVWARHAFAANGFGDADVTAPATASRPDAIEPHAAALQHRIASFWSICIAIGAAIGAALHKSAVRWGEWREMRRTYSALSQLDERTLKDIGFGDHEAGSIAAELAGRAERTRVHALRTLRDLTI
jgi:uncharacterized protein YjiS (DUF1127 family)